MAARLWIWFLAVGLVAAGVYVVVPAGIGADVIYVGVGTSGASAILLGVWLHNPVPRTPWYLMAAGQSLWVLGDAVGSWYQDVEHVEVFPSAADVLYLAAYPMLALGLLALIRGRRSGDDVGGLLDSATVTAGLGVLSWVLLARPTFTASRDSLATATFAVAYPIADIVLVGLLVLLITTVGGRTPCLRMLAGAVLLLIVGDTISSALGLYSSAGTATFDFIWLGSYLLWGAAALHPSMRALAKPAANSTPHLTRRRLVSLTLATLIAPATLIVEGVGGFELDVWAVGIGSVVLFLLVVARMNVAIERVVTAHAQRAQMQDALTYQAEHDSLTQLPNRAQAVRLIEGALQRAQRSGAMIGLLFVDLDGFKAVNDTSGHRAGDLVLRSVAQRMQAEVRGGDIVSRLGGDEFVILLETLETENAAIDIANRLLEAISAPIALGRGTEAQVGASIGVALSLDGATDPEQLLNEADIAVYRAKAAGRGRVEVFDNALRRELSERALLESALVRAIADDELVLHYQPVVDVVSGDLRGWEALIRWQRPDVGLVQPAGFIPAAEASTLICDVDAWALNRATQQLAAWNRHFGTRELVMAVNISGRHVSSRRILPDVSVALAAADISADQLVLEITETVLIDDLPAIENLIEIRALGVAISIDDFGTGYNSISRLQNLPIDIIKVDRSFLDDSLPAGDKLLQLMVQAAHAFGLPVIAEGVEHPDQLELLKSIGCESAQGFYIAAPMSAEEIEARWAQLESPV